MQTMRSWVQPLHSIVAYSEFNLMYMSTLWHYPPSKATSEDPQPAYVDTIIEEILVRSWSKGEHRGLGLEGLDVFTSVSKKVFKRERFQFRLWTLHFNFGRKNKTNVITKIFFY